MQTIISPSILSANFLRLEEQIQMASEQKNLWWHLDIMDSHFVPNLTFGAPVLKELSKVTTHKLDAHFMVTNPDFFVENFKELNIHNFTFHWEAVTHHDRLISYIKKNYPSAGISINPSTDLNIIPDYIFEKIDLILLMSVNPGFSGQKFISSVYQKIEKLQKIKKEKSLNFHIQIDGGVDESNAAQLIQTGATNLVSGSYLFSAKNKVEFNQRIESLRK